MSVNRLPIWRDANQFLLAIEKGVRLFPRYHKYTLGTELRKNALQICLLIQKAYQHKSQQCRYLQELKLLLVEVFLPKNISFKTKKIIIKQKSQNRRGILHRELVQVCHLNTLLSL
jgi:hypothetical protein